MSKNSIIIQAINKNLKKRNKFVIIINKINNKTDISKVINCINVNASAASAWTLVILGIRGNGS